MDGGKKVKVSPIPASGRHIPCVNSFDLWEDDLFAMGQHLKLLHNAFRQRGRWNETRSEVTFSRLGVISFIALHKNITFFNRFAFQYYLNMATSYVQVQIKTILGGRRRK